MYNLFNRNKVLGMTPMQLAYAKSMQGQPSNQPSIHSRQTPQVVGKEFFTIRVTNTDPNNAHEALVFDAKGLYAAATGFVQSGFITVECLDQEYISLLRQLVGSPIYIDELRLEVAQGKEAQFSRSISAFTQKIGVQAPMLQKTLKPGSGTNSYQQQSNRTEVAISVTKIGDVEAWVTTIEKDNYLDLKIFMQMQVKFN